MSSPKTPEPNDNAFEDEKALKDRYQQLKQKMEAANKGEALEEEGKGSAMGRAMRMGTEFVVAVLVGTFIGWQLDKWLDTKPWLLILFLLIGFGAGLQNVLRLAKQESSKEKGPEEEG